MDSTRADTQKIRNLLSTGKLKARSIIQVSEVCDNDDADLEDLLDTGFYLQLVNGAYTTELQPRLKVSDIATGSPRIVKRVEAYFSTKQLGRFNHYRPATYFLGNQGQLLPKLSDKTLDRAETLATKVNALLSQ